MSKQDCEILSEEVRKKVIGELLEVKNPSNEIGWRIFDYLEKIGMMPDGNILLNEEVDEITYMVKDYIAEKIGGGSRS